MFARASISDAEASTIEVILAVDEGELLANKTVAGVTVSGTATEKTFKGTALALDTYFSTASNLQLKSALSDSPSMLTLKLSDKVHVIEREIALQSTIQIALSGSYNAGSVEIADPKGND